MIILYCILSIFDVNEKLFQFECCLKNQVLNKKMTLKLNFANLPGHQLVLCPEIMYNKFV